MGLGDSQFPRKAGMFDARQWRGAGPARVARYQDMVCVCLSDARGHGTYANFRHQFDADSGRRIGVFQVVNQLGEVFDGVDVVMWRRADESHAGRRIANAGDVFIDFPPG